MDSELRLTLNNLNPKPSVNFLRCWYAYQGDWKNYEQVRYKAFIHDVEKYCIIHGCYFHLEFAQWCKDNMMGVDLSIDIAISGKLIMNNNLSYVISQVYCIWYPDSPSEDTCLKLYEQHPFLKYQIARVCVHYGYNKLFKKLDILPEEGLLTIAENTKNQELIDYINNSKEQKGLWRILSDTYGTIKSPVRVTHRSLLECEALTLDEMRNMYLNKNLHESSSSRNKVLKPCDMTFIRYDSSI